MVQAITGEGNKAKVSADENTIQVCLDMADLVLRDDAKE